MKANKVREILEISDKKSYKKNYDLSESTFSYYEVLNFIKMSDDELSIIDSKISICEELMKYLESKVRIIDKPKVFYSDEIKKIIEISELTDIDTINEKILEFKSIF